MDDITKYIEKSVSKKWIDKLLNFSLLFIPGFWYLYLTDYSFFINTSNFKVALLSLFYSIPGYLIVTNILKSNKVDRYNRDILEEIEDVEYKLQAIKVKEVKIFGQAKLNDLKDTINSIYIPFYYIVIYIALVMTSYRYEPNLPYVLGIEPFLFYYHLYILLSSIGGRILMRYFHDIIFKDEKVTLDKTP